jgi:hypothetical protein
MGHPINHSTHSGFSWPPSEAITAWSIRSFDRSFPLLRVRAAGDDPLDALAHGVGQVRADSASISVPPSRALFGVTRPPLSAKLEVGVGHILTAVAKPSPLLLLAPLRL